MQTSNRVQQLININVGMTVLVLGVLVYGLSVLNTEYEFGLPYKEYEALKKATEVKQDTQISVDTTKPTTVVAPPKPTPPKPGEPIPSSKPPIVKPKIDSTADTNTASKPPTTKPKTETSNNNNEAITSTTYTSGKKPVVTFIHVIFFTLLSGALGGLLANLRGIFKYSPNDRTYLEKLANAYYSRPFMSALAGFFTYFVTHLIAANVTVQPLVAQGVTYASFIGSMGFAMIAGFGSYEFMDRLKETARTLFGGTVPKTEHQIQKQLIADLKTFHQLAQEKIISEEDFKKIKEKIMKQLELPDLSGDFRSKNKEAAKGNNQ